MKKSGFTLAEVLITMGIIGVIAAITLPALNGNVLENTAVTKYKKAYMILNNVGQMLNANNKMDYSDLVNTKKDSEGKAKSSNAGNQSNGMLKPNLFAALDKYAKLDKDATAAIANSESGTYTLGYCQPSIGTVVFKDGTYFCYCEFGKAINGTDHSGHIYGVIDVNGSAGPNTISTCDSDGCASTKDIKDQFVITLHGEDAYAGIVEVNDDEISSIYNDKAGYAAKWALSK